MPTLRSFYRDGESWKTLYRLTADDGQAYAPGSIAEVVVRVTDESTDPSLDLYLPDDPAPGTVFFTTFQLSDGWDQDDIGFTFKHVISPGDLGITDAPDPDIEMPPEGGHVYKVRYDVETNTDGLRIIEHMIVVSGGLDG